MTGTKKYANIIEHVASENRTSTAEVHREMETAIFLAHRNPDPRIQAEWAKIPCRGPVPTPEELITYVVRKAKKKNIEKLLSQYF